MPDARVQSAIAHWAPRFVSNGVPLTDFEEVTAGVERWEDWCRAWTARAAVHEELGRKSLADGYRRSAGDHLTRAAVCYHFSKFVFVIDYEQMKAAHRKAVECRNLALPLLDPPGERVAIPYEGRQLYGNLRKPRGVAKPPVLLMCMGLDSTKEEMDANESAFLARGMATLTFDGPGQGEGEYDFAIRGDYEVAVRAVLDYVGSRGDLDAGRAGVWGVSLGGYYAPRAAAFDKRIKACIALSGPFEWVEYFDKLPELTRNTFQVRSKSRTMAEARERAATLTLKNVAKNITCPLFIVAGKQDGIVPWEEGERLAAAASGPVVRCFLEDGNHVANNRVYRYRSQSADWMARQLGVKPT
ncbi:MAG TPA: alpha/beta fold hydrolase [Burkholderiales bacterium]|nr:alpha/beta fold hydrolase [Burkholderiales bacterium]